MSTLDSSLESWHQNFLQASNLQGYGKQKYISVLHKLVNCKLLDLNVDSRYIIKIEQKLHHRAYMLIFSWSLE